MATTAKLCLFMIDELNFERETGQGHAHLSAIREVTPD